MPIRSFDHVAIPIQNTIAMLDFYKALGFGVKEREHFYSVHFGDQKTNFHAPERWQSGKFTLRGPTSACGGQADARPAAQRLYGIGFSPRISRVFRVSFAHEHKSSHPRRGDPTPANRRV